MGFFETGLLEVCKPMGPMPPTGPDGRLILLRFKGESAILSEFFF